MTGLEKILAEHLERRAFVYARQSTPAQVIHHRSSTERQIGLAERAAQLGWSTNLVDVVTDDLGKSGRYVEGREGFQRLAAEMTMGRVGAVFSLDASRLARSSADWHRLLEIAALTKTLLVDEQSVYDPRDPNDRLILGMKGTMADFELVWLRQRMEGGRWHLAKNGAYRFRPAAGYVHEDDESAKLVFDPDEEVQRAIKLLFERYRIGGTLDDVVRYFAHHEIRFPARYGTRLEWNRLNHSRVHAILTNPIYTGAYVFGRMRGDTILDAGRRRRRVQELPIESWRVTIRASRSGGVITASARSRFTSSLVSAWYFDGRNMAARIAPTRIPQNERVMIRLWRKQIATTSRNVKEKFRREFSSTNGLSVIGSPS